jgi:hypothetical protein
VPACIGLKVMDPKWRYRAYSMKVGPADAVLLERNAVRGARSRIVHERLDEIGTTPRIGTVAYSCDCGKTWGASHRV